MLPTCFPQFPNPTPLHLFVSAVTYELVTSSASSEIYHFLYIFNRQNMYQAKDDTLCFKITSIISNEFTSSSYDDVTKIAQTSVPQKSRSMRRKVCGSTFLNARHSETVPWKSTKNWNRCIEHHLVQMTLLAGGVDVFKAAIETSEISQSLKDRTLPHTRIAPRWWGMLKQQVTPIYQIRK